MHFKGATKLLLARYGKLVGEREAAIMAVYAAALGLGSLRGCGPLRSLYVGADGSHDVPWRTCYLYASPEVRKRFDAACQAVLGFELRMAHEEHRGWIENGRFSWYER